MNGYVDDQNVDKLPGDPSFPKFVAADLRKLAFWMLTGSGRTLLLIAPKGKVKSSPVGLNAGEQQFVEDLKAYCKQAAKGRLAGREVFLLRSLGRGSGIGFFETSGFYPDFILWIRHGKQQHILFPQRIDGYDYLELIMTLASVV